MRNPNLQLKLKSYHWHIKLPKYREPYKTEEHAKNINGEKID